MSLFSSADDAPEPERLVAYLDRTARAAIRMKHYAMAAHALREPDGLVLDLGCGAGHDLALLAQAGVRGIGVDPSAVLLSHAARRLGGLGCLLRATGGQLPFADRSLAGCRIERVLMHVVDPPAVLAEVGRVLRRGALITAFEPDWHAFRVRGGRGDEVVAWINNARHPGIGGRLWALLEAAGFDVLDRVEELSVWRSLDALDRVVGLAVSVEQAVAASRIDRLAAERWLDEQRAREARGEFYATMRKVMIVAATR